MATAPVSKAVLITGCSSGIGRATAERLAGSGWTVYASARRLASIERLAERGCKLLELDVCAAVARATAGAYDGPFGKLGGGPEAVAKKIEKAISARRPRTRYPVTPSARLILAQRRLLPDRGWDAFMRTQFPSPRRPE